MDLDALARWTDDYLRAWRTNDPDLVAALFAEGARYFTHPYREPWAGREEIVRRWTADPDGPDTWSADYRAIAVGGSTGVIRGQTVYLAEDGSVRTRYANVFVVEFDDTGRATSFVEWFMEDRPPRR